MNDKLQQFAVIAATIGMIILNWLAATGVLGGIDTGAVSAKYPTRITPASYAFAIWSLIYIGMIAFSIYQALPANAERFRRIRIPYILTCIANSFWLYFWALEMMLVCEIVIVILLALLALINIRLQRTETSGEYWFGKAPFGLYFGWVTAATILNTTIMLVSFGVELPERTGLYVGSALLLVAAALGVAVRFAMKNYFYPLAIAWAVLAIAVKQSTATMLVIAASAALVACLIAAASFIMDMKGFTAQRYE